MPRVSYRRASRIHKHGVMRVGFPRTQRRNRAPIRKLLMIIRIRAPRSSKQIICPIDLIHMTPLWPEHSNVNQGLRLCQGSPRGEINLAAPAAYQIARELLPCLAEIDLPVIVPEQVLVEPRVVKVHRVGPGAGSDVVGPDVESSWEDVAVGDVAVQGVVFGFRGEIRSESVFRPV